MLFQSFFFMVVIQKKKLFLRSQLPREEVIGKTRNAGMQTVGLRVPIHINFFKRKRKRHFKRFFIAADLIRSMEL